MENSALSWKIKLKLPSDPAFALQKAHQKIQKYILHIKANIKILGELMIANWTQSKCLLTNWSSEHNAIHKLKEDSNFWKICYIPNIIENIWIYMQLVWKQVNTKD